MPPHGVQGGKQLGMARARVSVFANDYIGVLRRRVARQMATPASQVRLLFSGEAGPIYSLCSLQAARARRRS